MGWFLVLYVVCVSAAGVAIIVNALPGPRAGRKKN